MESIWISVLWLSVTIAISIPQATGATEYKLPVCRVLEPDQYLYIDGEKQNSFFMELGTDSMTVCINSKHVFPRRKKERKEHRGELPPRLKKFINENLPDVPYVQRLLNRGVEKSTAIKMGMARLESLMNRLDPISKDYSSGKIDDDQVKAQASYLLNELGYKDICESIGTTDGRLRAMILWGPYTLPFVMGGSISMPESTVVWPGKVAKAITFTNRLRRFFSGPDVPQMCVISRGHVMYMVGDESVAGALRQIDLAMQGEVTEGPLEEKFVVDFVPDE